MIGKKEVRKQIILNWLQMYSQLINTTKNCKKKTHSHYPK